MVFPVVMYGCKRWTIKKAECQRIDAFEQWCWRRLLRQSSLRLMSIESVTPSNHLILYRPLLLLVQSFPASGSFPMSQFFESGGQSIGPLASASVLPVNIQDWFSLGLTGLISLQSKGLSRVSSSTTVQKHKNRTYYRPSAFLRPLHIQTQWSLVTIPFNKFYNYLHFTGGKTKFK